MPVGDLFDGSLLLQDVGAELWEVERPGGAPKLTVMWGTDLDDFDPHTQVCVEHMLLAAEFNSFWDRSSQEIIVPSALKLGERIQQLWVLSQACFTNRTAGSQKQ